MCGGSASVQGGLGTNSGLGVSSSSIPSGSGLGAGLPCSSSAAFAPFEISQQRDVLVHSVLPDNNAAQDDIVASGDGDDFVENPDKWSAWTPLDSSHEILFDGTERSALFLRSSGSVIPWCRIQTKVDKNIEYFSVKNSSNPCSVKAKSNPPSKAKCNTIFEQFPSYHCKVFEAESKQWLNQFSNAAGFDDSSLPRNELPPLLSEIDSVFASVASEATPKSFPLRPSCFFFINSLRPMMLGLPTARFGMTVFSDAFNRGMNDFNKPSKELLDEEYKSRMEFISASVTLSVIHAFSILFKASSSPSPLGAVFYSLFAGLRPFFDFVWSQAFLRFAKARSDLRKAAFTKPYLEIASKLILDEPFSLSLFSESAMKEVGSLLKSQNMAFGDILNLTSSAKAAHMKQRMTFINTLTAPPKPSYQGRKGPSYLFKGNQRRGSRSSFSPNRSSNNSPKRGGGRKFRGPKFHRRPRGAGV